MRSMLRRNRNNYNSSLCSDCGRDVFEIKQYYMIKDEIWNKYGNDEGLLCMDCLEKRAGFKMFLSDFEYELANATYLAFNRDRHTNK